MTQGEEAGAVGAVGGRPEAPPDDTGEALGLPPSAAHPHHRVRPVAVRRRGSGSPTAGRPRSADCRASPATTSTRRSPAATSASRRAPTTPRWPCTPSATWPASASAGWRCAGRSSASADLLHLRDPGHAAQPVRVQGRHQQPQGRGRRRCCASSCGSPPGDGPAWMTGGSLPGDPQDPDAHRDLGPHLARRAGGDHRARQGRGGAARAAGEFDELDFDAQGPGRRAADRRGLPHPARPPQPARRPSCCAAATTSWTAPTGWAGSTPGCSSSRSSATRAASSCRSSARWPRGRAQRVHQARLQRAVRLPARGARRRGLLGPGAVHLTDRRPPGSGQRPGRPFSAPARRRAPGCGRGRRRAGRGPCRPSRPAGAGRRPRTARRGEPVSAASMVVRSTALTCWSRPRKRPGSGRVASGRTPGAVDGARAPRRRRRRAGRVRRCRCATLRIMVAGSPRASAAMRASATPSYPPASRSAGSRSPASAPRGPRPCRRRPAPAAPAATRRARGRAPQRRRVEAFLLVEQELAAGTPGRGDRGDRLAGEVVVVQVLVGERAERAHPVGAEEAAPPRCGAAPRRRRAAGAARPRRRGEAGEPAQMVEPRVVRGHARRVEAERGGGAADQAERRVADADDPVAEHPAHRLGDHPGRVGEVDHPGAGRDRGHPLGHPHRDRDGAQAERDAAGAGRSPARARRAPGRPARRRHGRRGRPRGSRRRRSRRRAARRRGRWWRAPPAGRSYPAASPASTCRIAASRSADTSYSATSVDARLAGVAQQRAVHQRDPEPAAAEHGQLHAAHPARRPAVPVTRAEPRPRRRGRRRAWPRRRPRW